jgi:ubiquinone/menaquinone biosynthesis C-methylase UbiE
MIGREQKDEGAIHRAEPHFVSDHRRLVTQLAAALPIDKAMARAVGGGDYETIGAAEANLLIEFGFGAGYSLIDIGCGSGRLSSQLSKRFGDAITYLGTDVVPELLEYARQRAAPGYRFELTGGLTIPAADGRADFVVAISVFTHLRGAETASYLRDIHRTLKPGGLLVFSFLELPHHARIFVSSSIRKLIGKCHPENHFLSRKTILQLANELGFTTEKILPLKRKGVCWQTPDHSIAALRKL